MSVKLIYGAHSEVKNGLHNFFDNDRIQNSDITTEIKSKRNRDMLYRICSHKLQQTYRDQNVIQLDFIHGTVNSEIVKVLNSFGITGKSPATSTSTSFQTMINVINDEVIKGAMRVMISRINILSITQKEVDINLIKTNRTTRGVFAPPPFFPHNPPYSLANSSGKKMTMDDQYNNIAKFLYSTSH